MSIKETAALIWQAYQEIEAAEKLVEFASAMAQFASASHVVQHPSAENEQFNVSPALAESLTKARATLIEAQKRIEQDGAK